MKISKKANRMNEQVDKLKDGWMDGLTDLQMNDQEEYFSLH